MEISKIKQIIYKGKQVLYLKTNNRFYFNTRIYHFFSSKTIEEINYKVNEYLEEHKVTYFLDREDFYIDDTSLMVIQHYLDLDKDGFNFISDVVNEVKNLYENKKKNQEVKADLNKLELCLFPREAIEWGSRGMMYGKEKYYRGSYVEVDTERYINAALRHIYACQKDKEWDFSVKDAESGLPSIAQAMLNLAFIVTLSDRKGDFK